jgi:hypothetical protein
MVDVTTERDSVVFTVEGLDKLWSFRSRLELPLAHVTAVEHDLELVGRWWHGVKVWYRRAGTVRGRNVLLPRRIGVLGRAPSATGNHRVSQHER